MGSHNQFVNNRGVGLLGVSWQVSFTLFLLVVAIVWLSTPFCLAASQLEKTGSNGTEVAFTEELTGRELKKGALTVSFSNYRSSDGIFLRRRIEDYESDSKASNEFKSLLIKAVTIIEEGKKASHDGKQSLDRAVVRWRQPERSDAPLAIVWRDGHKVYILESSTLNHLRSFERQIYR